MSDEYEKDEYFGGVLKVEWASAMSANDILQKRRTGWILLSFCWDADQLRFIYYFVKKTYF